MPNKKNSNCQINQENLNSVIIKAEKSDKKETDKGHLPIQKRKDKYSSHELDIAEIKFTQAMEELYKINPFYYYVLRQLSTRVNSKFPAIAGVGYNRVTRNIILSFHPEPLLTGAKLEHKLVEAQNNNDEKLINQLENKIKIAKDDLVGLIEHECAHVSLNHIFNSYDYANRIDAQLMNVAQDLYINSTCKNIGGRFDILLDEKYDGLLKGGCFEPMFKHPDKYPHLFEVTTPSGEKMKLQPKRYNYFKKMFKDKDMTEMDHLDIYKVIKAGYDQASDEEKEMMKQLMKNMDSHEVFEEGKDGKGQPQKKPCQECGGTGKKGQDQEKGNGQEQGDGQGQGEEQGDGQGQGGGQGQGEEDCPACGGTGEQQGQGQEQGDMAGGIRQSDVDKTLLDAVQDLEQDPNHDISQAIGSLPADLLMRLEQLLETSSEFKKIIASFFASLKDNKKRKTWRKINPRYPELAPAKTKQKRPSILLGLDLSGSMMGDKVIDMMMYEIKMYCGLCENVWLVAGDTRETFRVKLKDDRHFKRLLDTGQIDISAGGGTELQFIWDAAKELKVDGVVCHTDGYIGSFEDYKIKTIMGIYPHGTKVEGYRCADIVPKGLLDK